MRNNLKKKVCSLLVATLMTTATFANGFTYGGITVSAEESNVTVQNSGNVEISGEKTYSDINDSTGSGVNTGDVETSTVETTTGETVETSTDETTMPETTVEPTTEEPTTEEPTTPQPTTVPVTTKPASTKVVAWGKNAAGQFVNGNKKVIKGATMKGVDVSYHNGTINWKKVSASDVDYAIIRCGYGDNIKSQDDKKWAENVAGCEKNNIPYGVYIYSYATSVKQAESEANHVLRLIKGHTLNFPIYYDMEDAVQAKLSKSMRTKIANKFLGMIKNAGYECGIYANLNWWNNYLDSSLGGDNTWRTWVAQYNNNGCDYKRNYSMWQSSSTAKVSGISGKVDINFWFGKVRDRSYDITVKKGPSTVNTVATPKPVKAPARVKIRSVKAGKKKATVKWKKISSVKGYRIQYSTSKKFTSKTTKSKYTKKTSIKIKKLKSKKTYYFRVKAYKKNAANKKVYSKSWSKVKHKKIK